MSERVYPETKGVRRQKTRASRITIKRDQKGTKKGPKAASSTLTTKKGPKRDQKGPKAASSTLTPKRDQKGTKIKLSLLSLHMASKTSLNQGSKCRRKLLICLEQSQSRSEKSISISLRSSINAISLRSSINLNLAPELNPIAPSSIFVSLQAWAQSRFNRGPSNSDTTRTATIKLPRHKKAVHISPIRLAHSPDSQFQSAHGLASSAVSLRSIDVQRTTSK